MVTTDALKLLYSKLGGTADVSEVTAISEMVDLIEDVAGSGGGGASGLLVTITGDEDNALTLDKSYNDLRASLESGIMPVFMRDRGGMQLYNFTLLGLAGGEGSYLALIGVNPVTVGQSVSYLQFVSTDPDEPFVTQE